MPKQHILIVEDDEDIQQLVSYNLMKAGLAVDCVASGEAALERLIPPPDLILLDLMLPGANGLEICRMLKADAATRDIPVVMLTAKGEEADIVAGLDLGADDYITKPFSPTVVIARIKAVLRRRTEPAPQAATEIVTIGRLAIDSGRHEVRIDQTLISLTPTEFAILELLARRAGWVFTRQQIIDAVRGYGYFVTPRAMDVQIFALRKKLGELGTEVETIRGIGYKFRGS